MSRFLTCNERVMVHVFDGGGAGERRELVAIAVGVTNQEAGQRAEAIVEALEGRHVAEEVMKGILGQEAIDAAVKAAVDAERLACARLAERYGGARKPQSRLLSVVRRHEGECAASANIARLIRQRSQE